MRCLWLALALGCPALTAAQTAEVPIVVSAAPDDVAVTIASDLALVRETRSVDLPLGTSIVELRGVADAIQPEAAALEGVDGVVERSFDYDVLTPYTLLYRALGRRATRVRTSPGSGAVTRESATLRASDDGVILDFGAGRTEALQCSGLPEALVLDGLPPGLRSEPTLSVRVRSARAGPQTLTLLYLVRGLGWTADYNLELSADGGRFDLDAWLTLDNESGTTFADAETAVLAGELFYDSVRLPEAPRRWPEHRCWERPPTRSVGTGIGSGRSSRGIEEITVTARKREEIDFAMAVREQLLDYHLYRIPWRTTVAARQSKQVRFLARRGIPVERLYGFWSDADFEEPSDPGPAPADVVLRFRDDTAQSLGEPLPAGTVRVTHIRADGNSLFVGEDEIPNTPPDLPVSLTIGSSSTVFVARTTTERSERLLFLTSLLRGQPIRRHEARIEQRLTNASATPVHVELRQGGVDRVWSASHPWTTDRGDPLWSLDLPPHSTTVLAYRARYDEEE